jgi:predicted DsbA family dithiol-disulfide isomerase
VHELIESDPVISHEFAASVIADEDEATRLGVNSVPAFIANRKAALSGVQPVGNLRKLLESVRGAG